MTIQFSAGRRCAAVCIGMVAAAALMGGIGAHAHGREAAENALTGSTRSGLGRLLPELFSSAAAAARMRIDESAGFRYFEADGLPDHATGQFPNDHNPNSIRVQSYSFRVTLSPRNTGRARAFGPSPFGIALNGVVFDPGTAEVWNNDPRSGWHYEALTGRNSFGLDGNNAHVQPNGAYHYHGMPTALLESRGYRSKPVLAGYAADGFPVYGPYGWRNPQQAGSGVVELRSGYRMKSGKRPGGSGGAYDGTFVEDYAYVAGSGDLDECNGRSGVTPEYPRGTYYYVLTATFPFIPRCLMGEMDASFERRPRGAPGGQDGARRPPPPPDFDGRRPPPR